MKIAIILLFCIVCGICLGGFAAIMMARAIQPAAFYAGSLLGVMVALICSPLFVLKRNHRNIFSGMITSFVLSFPVAVLCGMAWSPRVGIGLTLISLLSVNYLLLFRSANDSNEDPFSRKDTLVIPVICLMIAGVLAYTYDPLPDDIPSLITMMGDNDMQVSHDAATKLRMHGKAPFVESLQHPDSRVRSTAARFLGFLGDSTVQYALLEAANDPNPHVRMWVAFSLGKIGDVKALETLNRLADDTDAIVRNKATKAVQELKARDKSHQ